MICVQMARLFLLLSILLNKIFLSNGFEREYDTPDGEANTSHV